MTSLALIEDLERNGALTATGLTLPRGITREQYEALGAMLGRFHETVRFAIGDYLIEGKRLFGDDVYGLEALGISEESRMQYVRVAEAVEPARRRPELTWSHHRSVVAMEPKDQDTWLSAAVERGWTKGELEAEIRGERTHRVTETIKGTVTWADGNPSLLTEDGSATDLLAWLQVRDGCQLSITALAILEVYARG